MVSAVAAAAFFGRRRRLLSSFAWPFKLRGTFQHQLFPLVRSSPVSFFLSQVRFAFDHNFDADERHVLRVFNALKQTLLKERKELHTADLSPQAFATYVG